MSSQHMGAGAPRGLCAKGAGIAGRRPYSGPCTGRETSPALPGQKMGRGWQKREPWCWGLSEGSQRWASPEDDTQDAVHLLPWCRCRMVGHQRLGQWHPPAAVPHPPLAGGGEQLAPSLAPSLPSERSGRARELPASSPCVGEGPFHRHRHCMRRCGAQPRRARCQSHAGRGAPALGEQNVPWGHRDCVLQGPRNHGSAAPHAPGSPALPQQSADLPCARASSRCHRCHLLHRGLLLRQPFCSGLRRVYFQLPLVTSHMASALAVWVRHELAASVTVLKGITASPSKGW